eukprot:5737054-Pyramimonas_sp.AAC.1
MTHHSCPESATAPLATTDSGGSSNSRSAEGTKSILIQPSGLGDLWPLEDHTTSQGLISPTMTALKEVLHENWETE